MQPSLDTLLLENALLKSRLEAAQTRIQELEERVNLNSKNSSRPPSSDQKKQKKSETSKGGAQKGHPHNNRAERDLRSLVLWRKKSFGTKSQTGQRFVERISSVIKTLVKQGKNVLDFTSLCLDSSISNRKFPLIFSN